MHPRPLRTRCAFTLIELLTVIAIIGILAAIIVPTVSRVRNTAKKAQCVGRLRQWGSIISLCANDYKTNIPLFFNSSPFSYDPYITSGRAMIVESEKDGLSRNLKPYEAFTVCPTGINGGNTIGGTRQYNFAIPVGLAARSAAIFGVGGTQYSYRASEAASPAQLLLMIEMNNNSPLKPTSLSGIQSEIERDGSVRTIQTKEGYVRHGGLANALFLDGHVRSLSRTELDYSNSNSKPVLERWFTLQ